MSLSPPTLAPLVAGMNNADYAAMHARLLAQYHAQQQLVQQVISHEVPSLAGNSTFVQSVIERLSPAE